MICCAIHLENILEVEDLKDIYMSFQESLPIFWINGDIDAAAFMKKMNCSKSRENVIITDNEEYHYAFLFKCLVCSSDSNITDKGSDFSNLVYMLNSYICEKFDIYNAPYVRNRNGYKKWLQEFYILKQTKDNTNNKIAFIPGYMGNGEALISLPILNELIKKNRNKRIDILSYSSSVYEMLRKIFPECCHVNAVSNCSLSKYLEKIFAKYEYQSIYSQFSQPINSYKNKHRIDTFADLCKIEENIDIIINKFDAKKIIDIYFNRSLVESFTLIRKKNYKYIIASQFFTNSSVKRCLAGERLYNFVKLCRDMNIGIINLSIIDEIAIDLSSIFSFDNIYDFSKFSLLELAYVIYQSDIFVGIDSAFGHLAGLLSKPSITLWSQDNPVIFQQIPIGYRVIRNNYSFCLKKEGNECVSIIIDKIIEILEEKYKLKKNIITYNDSRNMLDCCVI